MTFAPVNSQSSYLPPETNFPEDPRLFRELLDKRERLTSTILNIKENGQYETEELLTGQQWFNLNTSQVSRQPRYAYRTVVDFGALPTASTKSVPHGINVDSNTIFTRIFATATYPGVQGVPIPYVNVTTPTDGLEIWVDPTNVNIKTTTGNWAPYTICYVVLEYLKG